MPHRIAGRKLGRSSSHRLHMLSNLAVAVVRYERVKTTEAKAKEVRGIVDGMITTAKRGDLQARRSLASQMPHEPLIVDKLMGELATKYADRSSGFTRDAAYAGFAEQKFGALEPGKWADFILVDRDVSAADPQALARTQVLETWVAGKKVWSGSASAAGERAK